jgi:hypothetical protein
MKPINTFCGQNKELLDLKAGGTRNYYLFRQDFSFSWWQA